MNHTIVIRADSGSSIGMGHIMRCLALADRLSRDGGQVVFVHRDLPGMARAEIERRGYHLLILSRRGSEFVDAEETASLIASSATVIVDHYHLGAQWEAMLRRSGHHIIAFDDLGRNHHADLVVSPLASVSAEVYRSPCVVLQGLAYAIVGEEFLRLRVSRVPSAFPPRVLHISFGGADLTGETEKALLALRALRYHFDHIDVVVGPANARAQKILDLAGDDSRIEVHVTPRDYPALLARADIALGSAGTSSLERCCLGIPSLAIAVAENQRETAEFLVEKKAHLLLGWSPDVSTERIARSLDALASNPEALREMSRHAKALIDGLGVVRVANRILPPQIALVTAAPEHCDLLGEWRNDERTRRFFHDPSPVPLEVHRRWFSRTIEEPGCVLLVAYHHERAVGALRYDLGKPSAAEARVSIYLDPKLQGCRYGRALLAAGNGFLVARHKAIKRIVAEIKGANLASRKAFLAAGYHHDHGEEYRCVLRED